MRHLSRNNLESIGERYVRAYKRLPEFKGGTVYSVSPSILIEQVLNLNIEYHHLSLDGSVLGVTTKDHETGYKVYDETDEVEYFFFDGNTILIEKDLRDDISRLGRRHYTEAHEASHQILQMLFPEDYMNESSKLHFCLATPEPVQNRDWKEWQADTLASVLLMPKELVVQAMQLHGLGEKINRLNRIWATEEYEKFCSMARLLGVSKQALSIRLSQLGLVEHNDFRNPYAVMNIEYE